MLWPKVLEADCAEEHSVIGTFGRRARRKIRQIARGGGTFRASKLSALGSHMCVWGNWAAAGPAAYEGLHDVGCALESFQFFSFEQFHVFFETNLGQKGWMTSPRRGLRTKKTRCRKVASRSTCYYPWNQVFVDATNQDMFLFINSKILDLEVLVSNMFMDDTTISKGESKRGSKRGSKKGIQKGTLKGIQMGSKKGSKRRSKREFKRGSKKVMQLLMRIYLATFALSWESRSVHISPLYIEV